MSVVPGKLHNQQLNPRLHDKLKIMKKKGYFTGRSNAILTIHLPGTALTIISDNNSPTNVYTVGDEQLVID